jgi:phosphohistidine phosphatase
MKTLILLRHAKSELPSVNQKDFDRRLNDRGQIDIVKVSVAFNLLGILPDCILCSSAVRTKETLDAYLKVSGHKTKVLYLDQLYHASASEILSTVNQYDNQYNCIMVVGHNFGISTLADKLSSNGAEQMSTSAIHVLEFSDKIEAYQGKLTHSLNRKSS